MRTLFILAAAIAGLSGWCSRAWADDCASLAAVAIEPARIGLPTAGAFVETAAAVVPNDGNGYCLVEGRIRPVDPAAPDIVFHLALPQTWNERVMMLGGFGFDGVVPDVAGSSFNAAGPPALSRGYAVFASDGGHQAVGDREKDLTFMQNDEAYRNYIGDALKKTRDAAVVLIERRYGRQPRWSYFVGASKGGGEALEVAGRWPADWDGILALAPGHDLTTTLMGMQTLTRALAEPGGHLNPVSQVRLHQAALEACDDLDGLKDGLISNVAGCRSQFDPATARVDGRALRCADGRDLDDLCLSDNQIAALRAIDGETSFDFAEDSAVFPGFNVMTADLRGMPNTPLAVSSLGDVPPAFPMAKDAARPAELADGFIRFAVTGDPARNSLTLDPSASGADRARLQALHEIDKVADDLRGYAARGGRLVIVHGEDDLLISARSSTQYVQAVKASLGEPATGSMLRYALIPGFGHGVGPSFQVAWDQIAMLEAWVEQDVDPTGSVVVTDVLRNRTRPLCPYPAWARYVQGDPDVAASFICAID